MKKRTKDKKKLSAECGNEYVRVFSLDGKVYDSINQEGYLGRALLQ